MHECRSEWAHQLLQYYSERTDVYPRSRHRYSGQLVREVSKLFKVSESAITEAARTFPMKMGTNKKLVEEIETVKAMLNICDL